MLRIRNHWKGSCMKKLSLATVGLAALVALPAMAADVAVRRPAYRAPPPPPPPILYSWTGCFVGGHVGGLWARKEWFDRTFIGQSEGSHDADGFLGGVQGGCDYQFFGGFVVGIQGDYAWTDADGSNDSLLFNTTNHSSINSLASVTGRVGFAWDRFLGYVRAGGAWERDEYHISSPSALVVASASETRGGWTAGIGGEYAFTNFLSAFVEYNYYDFGDSDLIFSKPGDTFVVGIDETKSVLKGGLNFRFGGWGGPAVARY
jgi:outer membrane immunogenic protein